MKIPIFFNCKLFSGAVIPWKGLVVTHTWSGIISAHIFRKSRTVLILERVGPNSPMLPLLNPIRQGSIEQAKLHYAAACSISLGFHRKKNDT